MHSRPATPAAIDFELGSLLESTCKRCHMKAYLPQCTEDCKLLDSVQKMLAGGISSVQSFSPCEAYSLLISD